MSDWDEAVVIALGSNLKGPYADSCELLEAALCRFRPEGLDVVVVPHPRARDRRFVMGPLAEIAPDWRCPETGEEASVLAGRCAVGLDARPI